MPPMEVIILLGGPLIVALSFLPWMSHKFRMRTNIQQRRYMKKWRRKHGLRRHEQIVGDAPMPFHVRRSGSVPCAYTGPSTEETDNLFAGIRRIFGSRKDRPKD
ncbi:MAG TPA: hypothetical protein VMT58_00485 [Candidatus Binataceae bacterium]|nr:hypothetical protein [Candidatus Binataceae bacterium]